MIERRSIFSALQFMRGTGLRAHFSNLAETMADRARAILGENDSGKPDLENYDDKLKLSAIQLVVGSLGEFTGHFQNKDLLLFEASEGQEFILGDNPVAMQNSRDFGPYGSIGLAVPGIEIYLPISGRYTLGYWCPTHLANMRAGLAEAERRIAEAENIQVAGGEPAASAAALELAQLTAVRDHLRRIPVRYSASAAIGAEVDHVTRLNSPLSPLV